jgi:protein-L-isoaspartate O-methyltransferase
MSGETVLDVGAGSGYAAAVASLIAKRAFAIERHRTLGESARDQLQDLGYDNIDLRIGDGTKGWPEAAPFVVILVAAGEPKCLRR